MPSSSITPQNVGKAAVAAAAILGTAAYTGYADVGTIVEVAQGIASSVFLGGALAESAGSLVTPVFVTAAEAAVPAFATAAAVAVANASSYAHKKGLVDAKVIGTTALAAAGGLVAFGGVALETLGLVLVPGGSATAAGIGIIAGGAVAKAIDWACEDTERKGKLGTLMAGLFKFKAAAAGVLSYVLGGGVVAAVPLLLQVLTWLVSLVPVQYQTWFKGVLTFFSAVTAWSLGGGVIVSFLFLPALVVAALYTNKGKFVASGTGGFASILAVCTTGASGWAGIVLTMVNAFVEWHSNDAEKFKYACEHGLLDWCESYLKSVAEGTEKDGKYVIDMQDAADEFHAVVHEVIPYVDGTMSLFEQLHSSAMLQFNGSATVTYTAPRDAKEIGALSDLECYQIKLIYRAIGLKHPNYLQSEPIKRRELVHYLVAYLTEYIYIDPVLESGKRSDQTPAQPGPAQSSPAPPTLSLGLRIERVKRYLLQRIFGVPSNMAEGGLPQISLTFSEYADMFGEWLDKGSDSTSSSIVRTTELRALSNKRRQHFAFVEEGFGTWGKKFRGGHRSFSTALHSFFESKEGYGRRVPRALRFFAKWDTGYRMFVRLMYLLAGSRMSFDIYQGEYGATTNAPVYGQFSWSDCAPGFQLNKKTRQCVQSGNGEVFSGALVQDTIYVRQINKEDALRKVEENKALSPEEKKDQIQKIEDEATWLSKLQKKLASMFGRFENKANSLMDLVKNTLAAASQWIDSVRKSMMDQWYDALGDDCKCDQNQHLENQGSTCASKLTWVGLALKAIWQVWDVGKHMVSWVKQDGSVINIPNAMYETAKFLHAHPMLVYMAVTIAEFTVKQMMEHILDECARDPIAEGTSLRGYFRKTDVEYRDIIAENFKTFESTFSSDNEKAAAKAFLAAHPHSVQAHRNRGVFLERTIYGPPFEDPPLPIQLMSDEDAAAETAAIDAAQKKAAAKKASDDQSAQADLVIAQKRAAAAQLLADEASKKAALDKEDARKKRIQAKVDAVDRELKLQAEMPFSTLANGEAKTRQVDERLTQLRTEARKRAEEEDNTSESGKLQALGTAEIPENGFYSSLSWLRTYIVSCLKWVGDWILSIVQPVYTGVCDCLAMLRGLLVHLNASLVIVGKATGDALINIGAWAKTQFNDQMIKLQTAAADVASYVTDTAANMARTGAENTVGVAGVEAGIRAANLAKSALEGLVNLTTSGLVATADAGAKAINVASEAAQFAFAKQDYGTLSLMTITAVATFKPGVIEDLIRKWMDSMFNSLEVAGTLAATGTTVLSMGFGSVAAFTGLAAWKAWIMGSRLLITEFVAENTSTLIELCKWALSARLFIDNIYGLINMFSLDKLLAMFGKHTVRFPYFAANLRDMANHSWLGSTSRLARLIARPAGMRNSLRAHAGQNELVPAKLDPTQQFWIPAEDKAPGARMVPAHMLKQSRPLYDDDAHKMTIIPLRHETRTYTDDEFERPFYGPQEALPEATEDLMNNPAAYAGLYIPPKNIGVVPKPEERYYPRRW